jgi:hypothetical protein
MFAVAKRVGVAGEQLTSSITPSTDKSVSVKIFLIFGFSFFG